MPQINKSKWAAFPGFFHGFRDLDDALKWEIYTYLFAVQTPPPYESVLRCDRHAGFALHFAEPWLDNYTAQEYILRWWFPEDPIYRNFALAPELNPGRSAWTSTEQPHGPLDILRSVGSSLAQLGTPEGQQRVYRLVMYRDLPARIDGYPYRLYVRNDLLPAFNDIRYR